LGTIKLKKDWFKV